MVFTAAGLLLGPEVLDWLHFDLGSSEVRILAEIDPHARPLPRRVADRRPVAAARARVPRAAARHRAAADDRGGDARRRPALRRARVGGGARARDRACADRCGARPASRHGHAPPFPRRARASTSRVGSTTASACRFSSSRSRSPSRGERLRRRARAAHRRRRDRLGDRRRRGGGSRRALLRLAPKHGLADEIWAKVIPVTACGAGVRDRRSPRRQRVHRRVRRRARVRDRPRDRRSSPRTESRP